MDEQLKTITEMAEEYSFSKGISHGNRTEPAWHYTQIDYLAGDTKMAEMKNSEIAPNNRPHLRESIAELRKALGNFKKESA